MTLTARRFGAQSMTSELREVLVKRPCPAFGDAFDDREQLVDVDRLGDVGVHARLEAFFAVPVHGMSCHRDNGS